MSDIAELAGLLHAADSLPFLFVGSGVSRRYLGHDDWKGLLTWAASLTDEPFPYYMSRAHGDLATCASEIAATFHEQWWHGLTYRKSRRAWSANAMALSDPLKYEIVQRLNTFKLIKDKTLLSELDVLAACEVDGIITTNYDALLEGIFSSFKVFVGQEDLLVSRSYQLGEIYKIHGSIEDPSSMVLTHEDYEGFDQSSPYLVAKLMSVFVEHPVVFLGYSLTDRNIRTILSSLIQCLSPERLEHFKSRFVWIDWIPSMETPVMDDHVVDLGEGRLLPVVRVRTSSYLPIFEVLASLERRLPLALLRRVQESVVEIVRSTDPERSIAVVNIDDIDDLSNVRVVVGVGRDDTSAHQNVQRLLGKGLLPLERSDLLRDVLIGNGGFVAADIVKIALPSLIGRNPKSWWPVAHYVDLAGLPDAEVPQKVKDQLGRVVTTSYAAIATLDGSNYGDVVVSHGLAKTLGAIPKMPITSLKPAELRDFLVQHLAILDGADSNLMTSFAKATIVLDQVESQQRRLQTKQQPLTIQAPASKVRAWAIKEGLEVGSTGRIPTTIYAAYENANSVC